MSIPNEISMLVIKSQNRARSPCKRWDTPVFYPYYTVEYMRGRVKKATKKAIAQQIVEPHWDKLSPSQQESILSLLEEIER